MSSLFRFRIALPVSFPLLDKELREQANRKRTYILRVLLIGALSLVVLPNISGGYNARFDGDTIYFTTLLFQLFAMLILLPGIMAPVISVEKERNSLDLLFLTRMKPWEIILQKYLSRLIPVMIYFLLSLPLLAIAYSYGGVSGRKVYVLPVLIVLLLFYIGAYSLFFSTYFSSTVSSVICSYVFTMLNVAFVIFTISNHFILNSEKDLFEFLFVCLPLASVFFLAASVRCLSSSALRQRRNVYMSFLARLDSFWKRINAHFGGIELVKDRIAPEPFDNPIAWYEKAKSPIGRASYRIRFGFFLGIPAFLIILFNCLFPRPYYHGNNFTSEFVFIGYALFAGIILCACGSSAIAAERKNQTLDILLTTPLEPREIIRQKMKKCRVYTWILMIPLTGLGLMLDYVNTFNRDSGCPHLALLFAMAFVYLPLISWFSCWIGLVVKSHARAILASLITLVLWIISPLPLLLLYDVCAGHISDSLAKNLFSFSPLIPFTDLFRPYRGEYYYNEFGFYIFSFLLACACFVLRTLCLERANQYLRKQQ